MLRNIVAVCYNTFVMAKRKIIDYSQEEKKEILKDLFILLNEIKDKKDFRNILLSLLTTSEIITISKRLKISKDIIEGLGYREIAKKEKTGPSAIRTVNRLLVRNDNFLEKELKKYFKKIKSKDKDLFRKNKLYNYPGYELAAKIFGIEYIDKKIQNK